MRRSAESGLAPSEAREGPATSERRRLPLMGEVDCAGTVAQATVERSGGG